MVNIEKKLPFSLANYALINYVLALNNKSKVKKQIINHIGNYF